MGRSQNPMDVHRRKQRQKELKRNKEKRITARDERVKETKTVQSIQDEIQKLQRRGNHKQAHEVQRLERLKKELKIVQQASASNPRPPPQQQPLIEKLDNPAKSIYYDPQLNPYGAPPPGKPKLYHSRGGGVTSNLKDAIVPGQPETEETTTKPTPHARHHSRSAAKPLQPAVSQPKQETKNDPPPKDPPSLPAPSNSVRRLKSKRGLDTDIWATTEEVEYERYHRGMDLEQGVDDVVVTTEDDWYYQDTQGQLQGPFTTLQMQQWSQHGYFPGTTRVRLGNSNFRPLSQWKGLKTTTQSNGADSSVQDRIAALRQARLQEQKPNEADVAVAPDVSETVQDRIAALRQARLQEQKENGADVAVAPTDSQDGEQKENDAVAPDFPESVQDRIAALRQARLQEQKPNDAVAPDVPETVQDRIAALRQARLQEQKPNEADVAVAPDVPETVQDRIAALRQARLQEQKPNEANVAAAPTDSQDGEAVVAPRVPDANEVPVPAAPYPVEAINEPPGAVAMDSVPLAPYPVDQGEIPIMAPYPSAEAAMPMAPYPVDDAMPVAPYPVDDGPGVVAPYPVEDVVTASYPIDDEFVPSNGTDLPITGAYPVAEDYPEAVYPTVPEPVVPPTESEKPKETNSDLSEPPQKRSKVDKALVSLMPSHLQKRRVTSKKR